MMEPLEPHQSLLIAAGTFSSAACFLSFWLIAQHQANMTWIAVQSKICAILWMVPIYAINSFLSLLFPSAALYIDMLRDCYEAYVLFVFLSLMLSYLNCDQEYDDNGRNFDLELLNRHGRYLHSNLGIPHPNEQSNPTSCTLPLVSF